MNFCPYDNQPCWRGELTKELRQLCHQCVRSEVKEKVEKKKRGRPRSVK